MALEIKYYVYRKKNSLQISCISQIQRTMWSAIVRVKMTNSYLDEKQNSLIRENENKIVRLCFTCDFYLYYNYIHEKNI